MLGKNAMVAPAKPLTEQQQAIVNHNTGPALVFAVAGAGKTTAMVHRIERLVRERIFAAERILATSFSRATVQDVRAALSRWSHCAGVRLMTLHALGYRVIRQAQQRGYLPVATFDDSDSSDRSRSILYQALAQARQQNVAYRTELDTIDIEDFLNFVGACKGNLRYADLEQRALPAAALTVATQAQPPPNLEWYLDLYRRFEAVRQQQGQITFDDMLMTSWELLMQYPDLLDEARRQYQCVLVDEFQDVNLAQSEILDVITFPVRNYMAIGDDDQTIYEWRGAEPRFILGFQQRYQAPVYLIEENFRCKASQVALANQVIEHNRQRQPKRLGLTQGFDGATIVSFEDGYEAVGRSLVAEIAALHQQGTALTHMAVLVRVYAQTPSIEHCLIEAHIPYRIVGSVPFYQRSEVVTLMNYLHLGHLEYERQAGRDLPPEQIMALEAAWRNVYNQPKRYLSREWSEKVWTTVIDRSVPPSQALRVASKDVHHTHLTDAIESLAQDLTWLATVLPKQPAAQVLDALDTRLHYSAYLRQSSGLPETGEGRVATIKALIDYARNRGTALEFMQHLAELEQAGYGVTTGDQYVTLTTVFRAKGLEWPVVFIPHCNDGIFPFGEGARLEEERRLLYVAITRSQRHLHLHCLKNRPISPFLHEATYRETLDAIHALQSALARNPQEWNRQDALAVALYPPRYHLERYFLRWWPVSPETRAQAVRAIWRVIGHTGQVHDAPNDLESLWQTLATNQYQATPAPSAERKALKRSSVRAQSAQAESAQAESAKQDDAEA